MLASPGRQNPGYIATGVKVRAKLWWDLWSGAGLLNAFAMEQLEPESVSILGLAVWVRPLMSRPDSRRCLAVPLAARFGTGAAVLTSARFGASYSVKAGGFLVLG